MSDNKGLKTASLYAGIGGICKAFKDAGFQMVWANEYDKYACETYRLNFDHDLIEGDVNEVDVSSVKAFDVLTAGFPCQSFSIAGNRKGFGEDRGLHFFKVMDFIRYHKPSVVFLENVKSLETHDKGNTFRVVKQTLESADYYVHHRVLNTMEYSDIPQNRERIYIVAFRDIDAFKRFKYPDEVELNTEVQDLLDQNKVDDRYYYTDRYKPYSKIKEEVVSRETVYQWRRKYVRENKKGVCPTLTANMGTGGHNVPIVLMEHGIRKLTPEECFRLQGFSDIVLPKGMAISRLYKQAGNSVTVTVVRRIAENIQKALEPVEEKDKPRSKQRIIERAPL